MTDDSSEARDRKALVRGYFGGIATTYDSIGPPIFTVLGRMLVERADIPRGAHVLDVATGRGAQLFAAADAVGPTGHVVGVDLSPEMVREAAIEIAQRGVTHATIRQMDAEALEFPDATFDRVTCGFALFFFPAAERALAEFHRVLRPGGKVATSTWGELDPRWAWYDELTRRHNVPNVNIGTGRFKMPSELESALGQTGFVDVKSQVESIEFIFANEDEWWDRMWAHGGSVELAGVAQEILARFKADAFERMQAARGPEGLHRVTHIVFATATKPPQP